MIRSLLSRSNNFCCSSYLCVFSLQIPDENDNFLRSLAAEPKGKGKGKPFSIKCPGKPFSKVRKDTSYGGVQGSQSATLALSGAVSATALTVEVTTATCTAKNTNDPASPFTVDLFLNGDASPATLTNPFTGTASVKVKSQFVVPTDFAGKNCFYDATVKSGSTVLSKKQCKFTVVK